MDCNAYLDSERDGETNERVLRTDVGGSGRLCADTGLGYLDGGGDVCQVRATRPCPFVLSLRALARWPCHPPLLSVLPPSSATKETLSGAPPRRPRLAHPPPSRCDTVSTVEHPRLFTAMFTPRRKVALTLFCLVVALGLATVSEANSLVHPARDHVELSRMIKKRSPQGGFPLFPVIGAEGDPARPNTDTATTTGTTSTTAAGAGPTTGTTSVTDPLLGTDTETTTTTTGATDTTSTTDTATTTSGGSTTTTDTTGTSTATSTTSTETSSSTSTTAAPTPTQDPNLTFTQAPNPDTQDGSPRQTSTNFVTVTDSSGQPENTSAASTTGAARDPNSGKITKTTLIVIAVIASTVGAVALAWTVFRKWKLRPSSNFDDRMQPIDWQPTGPDDSGIIPNHRRAASNASHGSFHSSGHSDGGSHAPTLQPVPEHDFTAGPSALAPVGGYADLQRGPSPQPSMAELSRGPSLTRPGYDYGVPAHHQGMGGAYDYNHGMRY